MEDIVAVKDKALGDIGEKIALVERLNIETAELRKAKVRDFKKGE